jgi:hypothetical protein
MVDIWVESRRGITVKLSKSVRKQWKDFEVLIADVETVNRGRGAKVTWNDRISDKIGIPRQIDISVRTQGSDGDRLTMIEARNRGRKGGVMWVDEVVGKRKTLPADEAIMVSKKPFCKDAQRLASSEGIETRTFEEVRPENLRMMFPNKVEHHEVFKRREGIQVRLRRQSDVPIMSMFYDALKSGDPVAVVFPDGERAHLLDAADEAISLAPLPSMNPSFTSAKLVLSLLPRTVPAVIEFRGISLPVAEINVEYIVEAVPVSVETVWGRYRSGDGNLDDLVERTQVDVRGEPCAILALGETNGNSFKVRIPRSFANEDIQHSIDPIHGAQIEVYVDNNGRVNMRRLESD